MQVYADIVNILGECLISDASAYTVTSFANGCFLAR